MIFHDRVVTIAGHPVRNNCRVERLDAGEGGEGDPARDSKCPRHLQRDCCHGQASHSIDCTGPQRLVAGKLSRERRVKGRESHAFRLSPVQAEH